MKKMPTLYKRIFENHEKVGIENIITPGCEWVEKGEGIATQKLDGTCCLLKDGNIYARFDYKPGRKLPTNAIPCQETADEITGHFPHWVLVEEQPQYKYHKEAFERLKEITPDYEDGTYELCGPHFNRNPENLPEDTLLKHGNIILDVPRSFSGIKEFLEKTNIEGIVFHHPNGSMCKIKRSDFGFPWNK